MLCCINGMWRGDEDGRKYIYIYICIYICIYMNMCSAVIEEADVKLCYVSISITVNIIEDRECPLK